VDTFLILSILRGQGVINGSSDVEIGNLVPTESPEVRMICGAGCVVSGVSVSPSIAQPNIISCIGNFITFIL